MKQAQVQLKDQGFDRAGNTFNLVDFSPATVKVACEMVIASDADQRLPPGTLYEIFVRSEPEETAFGVKYIIWLWTLDTDQDAPEGAVVLEGDPTEEMVLIKRVRTPE